MQQIQTSYCTGASLPCIQVVTAATFNATGHCLYRMCTRGASSIVIQCNDATRRYAGCRRRYGLGERDDELLGISGALWRPEADGWRPYERQAGPRRVSDLEDRVDQPQRWRAPEAAVVCLVERAEPRQRVGGAVSV